MEIPSINYIIYTMHQIYTNAFLRSQLSYIRLGQSYMLLIHNSILRHRYFRKIIILARSSDNQSLLCSFGYYLLTYHSRHLSIKVFKKVKVYLKVIGARRYLFKYFNDPILSKNVGIYFTISLKPYTSMLKSLILKIMKIER